MKKKIFQESWQHLEMAHKIYMLSVMTITVLSTFHKMREITIHNFYTNRIGAFDMNYKRYLRYA